MVPGESIGLQTVQQIQLQSGIEGSQWLIDQDQSIMGVPQLGKHPRQLDARLLAAGQCVEKPPQQAMRGRAGWGVKERKPPKSEKKMGWKSKSQTARLRNHGPVPAQVGQAPIGQPLPMERDLSGGWLPFAGHEFEQGG